MTVTLQVITLTTVSQRSVRYFTFNVLAHLGRGWIINADIITAHHLLMLKE